MKLSKAIKEFKEFKSNDGPVPSLTKTNHSGLYVSSKVRFILKK